MIVVKLLYDMIVVKLLRDIIVVKLFYDTYDCCEASL